MPFQPYMLYYGLAKKLWIQSEVNFCFEKRIKILLSPTKPVSQAQMILD